MKRQAELGSGAPRKRGKRHPLLYQQRFNEMVFWPGILIAGVSVAMIVLGDAEVRPYFVAILFGSGAILVLTFLFRLRAYVQCRPSALRVQLPFFHLEIPYEAIQTTRPTDLYRLFVPYEPRWTQRQFLNPLWGTTVVVVDLEHLPAERHQLRLWLSPFMLSPESPGLVLTVREWIALRGELDEFKARAFHAGYGP